MSGHVTVDAWFDLLRRVEALEAANVPPPDPVDSEMQAMGFVPLEYTRHPAYRTAAEWKDKHDQQTEKVSGLERELGSVLDKLRIAEADVGIQQRKCGDQQATISSYRTMLKNATAKYATQYKRAEANQTAANLFAKLRDGMAILNDGKDAWLTCIAPTQIAAWQAAADTLERLRNGAVIDDGDGGKVFLTGKHYYIALQELEAMTAERDALAAKVAETEAARVAAEELANANEADVRILERRSADLQSRLKQCEAVVDAWAPYKSGEWVAAVTLAELRRDAERWRKWCDVVADRWKDQMDEAIVAEKEERT